MKDDRLFTVLLVVLVVGLIYLAPPRQTPSDTRIAQLEANVAALHDTLTAARRNVGRAETVLANRKQSLQRIDTVLRIGVRRARAVLADSAASPDTVRQVLARTVDKIDAYQIEVLQYGQSVDSLLIAYVRERQAFVTQIDTLTALTEVQMPTRCTIWGMPCPNRTTAFWLGVGSAFVVTLAVAF